MKQTFFGSLYLSLAASIWGGMYVVSKYVLDYVPPFTLVWLRYAIAFFVLWAILRLKRIPTPKEKENWKHIISIGIVGYVVSISLQFVGTKWSDAHTASLITSATPAFIVIFARWMLNEAMTLRKLSALLLATAGVVVVVGFGGEETTSFFGNVLLVGAAVTWALLSVLVKIASARLSVLVITTYAIFVAFIGTTPLMVWEWWQVASVTFSFPVVLGVIYLGVVSTAGAFFLWNKGMEMMDASVGSLFFFFQPLVGSLFGWLFLHEQLHVSFWIGGAFIIVGVIVAVFERKPSDV
ncbi:drug/metabolite transporter (DMT)-like permease [Anoxybacillus mongoliensis]|uniref:Drug/metabolite transporter (DMT)-like permease n=1 Tax=Anoxybacillus mongoliensis TaxID=452565 RepID=A0A7W8N6B7_9BACL|nr:DMT family transporter [Anoxybacillus mongoliensis]MBB5354195.1 drug/metabolite transporter (DMT)-like permease [Anoxybacillus mongoliensis]